MSVHRFDAMRLGSGTHATPHAQPPVLDAETARNGIAAGHLTLAFQPIACLSHGLSHRSQVLARWRSPGDRTRPLDELVAGADIDGTAALLGGAVLDRATLTMAHTGPSAQIAIRLPGAQFRDPTLASDVFRVLNRHRLGAGTLSIQVPAMAALADVHASSVTLQTLRDMGCLVGLADLGSLIGSLSQLHRLPLDFVQIGRATIARLLVEPDVLSLVGTLLTTADERGLPSIAEGVETIEQLDWLRELGCGLAQGPVLGPVGRTLDLPAPHACSAF